MAKAKKAQKWTPNAKVFNGVEKFKSLSDAYKRAEAGDRVAQLCIISCLSNFGCEHLAEARRTYDKMKWRAFYSALTQDYIGALVGEYGESEDKAEREVLGELNSARGYYDNRKDEDPINWEVKVNGPKSGS